IAAHTALTAGNMARVIRAGTFPGRDEFLERMAQSTAAEAALTSRTEIESEYRKNTAEVLAALDSLTPEQIGASLETGFGQPMPMTLLMQMPGIHGMSHAAQIEYLQTCWGDQEMHF
ncbi:MAG: hypothetical protein KGK12_13210, partial [Armatimonadetes bacterium]|nr:hypothetical protein [Armatimonadota bacterium]